MDSRSRRVKEGRGQSNQNELKKKAAGLRVNYEKSALIGIGSSSVSLDSMAAILGCKSERLLFTFLGIPEYGLF